MSKGSVVLDAAGVPVLNLPQWLSIRGEGKFIRFWSYPPGVKAGSLTKQVDGRKVIVRTLEEARRYHEPRLAASRGQVVLLPAAPREEPARVFKAGTLASMCADYLASPKFLGLGPDAQWQYRYAIETVQEHDIAHKPFAEVMPGEAKRYVALIKEAKRKAAGNRTDGGAWALRTGRILSTVVYALATIHEDAPEHPNYWPAGRTNPFARITDEHIGGADIGSRVAWPPAMVEALVAFCDEIGEPDMGDVILFGYRLGARVSDLVRFPASYFIPGEALIYNPNKTRRKMRNEKPATVPWSLYPDLVERFEGIETRRAEVMARVGKPAPAPRMRRARRPETFIFSSATGGPLKASSKWLATRFRRIRDKFAKRHPVFKSDHPTWHYKDERLVFDVRKAEIGAIRHTAITQMWRAGNSLGYIASITGHSEKAIDRILTRYGFKSLTAATGVVEAVIAFEAEAKGKRAASAKVIPLASKRRARKGA